MKTVNSMHAILHFTIVTVAIIITNTTIIYYDRMLLECCAV